MTRTGTPLSRDLEITRFEIAIADTELRDLRERLTRTRWPNQISGAGWDYGAELGYVRGLCEYWADGYDWRVHEARLNRWDQFTARIDGQQIHFIHARSPEPDAKPVLISHGWPGSVVEFMDVIDPLRDPASHGGDPADALHLVCPTLPGFGFSGPTTDRGWSPRRIATAYGALMRGLGYGGYGVQGGDWGALVALHMADLRVEGLDSIHLNLLPVGPPKGFDMSTLTKTETERLANLGDFMKRRNAYLRIQRSQPQTIGYSLDDSPAGLAAWIAEKFVAWTDCADENGNRDLDRAINRDQLLTNIMTYWLTRTATSSARIYHEGYGRADSMPSGRVELPVGCALYPKEMNLAPRAWAEAAYNVQHWAEMPRGGHFAAMEQPALFVDDVRAYFRTQR